MATFIVGDVHGHLGKLIDLLTNAGLIDEQRRWSGGTAHLWFMGDFFDRGPHGIGVVDLVMRLQGEAEDAGGAVRALLGNHEILFLSAHRFPWQRKFVMNWKRNGGQDVDIALVTSRQIAWLRSLPALALVQGRLMMHADAMFYLAYGETIDEINEAFGDLLRGEDMEAWDEALDDFSERMAFTPPGRGASNAAKMLDTLGGEQIVHGHTPIQYVSDTVNPQEPLIYTDGLCVNVDGGMYLGGTGFVCELD